MHFPAFRTGTRFFDVHGIPVSEGGCESGEIPVCAAWDVSPPRRFESEWVRRFGKAVSVDCFQAMVTDVFAGA